MKKALILLAHGSRDPAWRKPVERLARLLGARLDAVSVAYLENTHPDLESQVSALAARGFRHLSIVPVFIGSGRHLKRDLARKAGQLRKRHAGIRISVKRAVGEQPRVIRAIADAIASES